jgi:hypothetical protein
MMPSLQTSFAGALLLLLLGGCADLATKQDVADLEHRLTMTMLELALQSENAVDLGGGWYAVDSDGDGDYERLWNDHGETPPDGEEGPDIADEVYEDNNNDGKWDRWYFDADDNPANNDWERWKRDTDKDGKWDQEWEQGRDDANGNKVPDENEWRDIPPEDPAQPHPEDRGAQ